jgi:hypothetical protein
VFLNYPCIPSASISPGNREYTVVPTLLAKSAKVPRDEKCLGPTKPLIRPFARDNSNYFEGAIFARNNSNNFRVVICERDNSNDPWDVMLATE